MAGGGASEAQFTGWQKHFNTTTLRGRSNITFVTYGALAMFGIYKMLKPKKKVAEKQ